jgi:predicted O-linked N-acetylglucosamine transferase (SPINDLY family)
MDYRLSDQYLDPPERDESIYSEQTIRLAHSFWCYDPLETPDIEVGPLPAERCGVVRFGCLNKAYKINGAVLKLWGRALAEIENSRLLLLAPPGSHRERTRDRLAKEGIAPQRVEFCEPLPRREYLELYRGVDLGLDSFPYNGHTTSLDSLWMGVPVVTLMGERAVSRAGWSQLSNLGLAELAARTPEQFVEIAVGLARDIPKLENLRRTLRGLMERSPLMDAAGFAESIEGAYREMWRRWCNQGS